MSDLTVLSQDLPDFLQDAPVSELTRSIVGNRTGGVKRIVHKNGTFRKVVGGEEMGKSKGPLDVIIVNASPAVGRIFYAKQWTPDSEPTAPDCFSNDGQRPDAGAQNPQSKRCDECPNNVKGSGQGSSKACRYSRKIAVTLVDDFGTSLEGSVYQINLASKSLFGDSVGENSAPFENYAKYVANNGKSIDWVITRITSNDENDNQSILFTPVGHINKAQYAVTSKLTASEDTKRLVVMTPYQADMAGKKALAAPAAEADSEEEVPAPKKRETKKAATPAAPTAKQDLSDVLAEWGDD
jgi:hypothetical protein